MAKVDSISSAKNTEDETRLEKWSAVNPLIDSSGGTEKVEAVLSALSSMIIGIEDQNEITLEGSHFGLACILDTCSAALAHMR